MRKSEIFEVAVKILGLYFLLTVIGTLRDVLTYVAFDIQAKQYQESSLKFSQTPFFIVSIFIFLLLLALSLFLTFKTKTVVRIICSPADFEETTQFFAEKSAIYEMALIIGGLLLILWTLPDFVFRLINYLLIVGREGYSKTYDTNFLIIAVIKITAGVFAVTKAGALSKFFSKEKQAS